MYRGKYAILPGIVTYGLIAGLGQYSFTYLRHKRQKIASTWNDPTTEKQSLLKNLYVWNPSLIPKEADDPLKSAIQYIVKLFGDLPDWASPFGNALDIEYRERLIYRIKVLEEQIEELKKRQKS